MLCIRRSDGGIYFLGAENGERFSIPLPPSQEPLPDGMLTRCVLDHADVRDRCVLFTSFLSSQGMNRRALS